MPRNACLLAAGWIVLGMTTTTLAQYESLAGLEVLRPDDLEHAAPVPPPEGAIVLLEGATPEALVASFQEHWVRTDGQPATWEAVATADGAAAVQVASGGIKTKQTFDGHFKLHVEFRVPYEPNDQGQARGNSGVYLQGRYEVQILDSYGLDSQDNDCGGIYEVARPLANACKAPTIWQSYDIEFHAPACDGGTKTSPARMTVYHNGVKIHDDQKIPVDNTRAGLGGDPCTPGPIHLQDHGDPVQFRNIWLLPLD